MRYCLTLFLISVIHTIVAQHTIPVIEGDTVFLEIDSYRGDLQWQISNDQTTWMDLPGRTYDTIKYVPSVFPSYFRLKITEENCEPHYSEIVKVILPDLPVISTVTPGKIRPYNAQTGGNITDDGGAPITARGVVYSTNANPTLETAMFTTDGTGDGSFASQLINLTPSTIYFVRAYATNMKGTSYGTQNSFFTVTTATYSVGEVGPAGGIVFYNKGNDNDGWRYLEVSPKHWSGDADPWLDIDWGCDNITIGGTSTAVGTGKENTEAILAHGCLHTPSPVGIANDAVINGFTDWFLPSLEELELIYDKLSPIAGTNFHSIYGFDVKTYTSSSENNDTSVWGIAFGSGSQAIHGKTSSTIATRPIRRF